MSSVFAKLLQAQQANLLVECDGEVTTGFHYQYASAEAIITAARGALNSAGLAHYAETIEVLSERTEKWTDGDKEKCARWIRIRVTWCIFDSESSVKVQSLGEALDSGDNASTKAQTDAEKSLWLKVLMISVRNGSRSQHGQQKQQRQPRNAPNTIGSHGARPLLELAREKGLSNQEVNEIVLEIAGRKCLVKELTAPEAATLRKTFELISRKAVE